MEKFGTNLTISFSNLDTRIDSFCVSIFNEYFNPATIFEFLYFNPALISARENSWICNALRRCLT